ncbi:MAG: TonB family protein [Deltaproteobacteria bacterium]|jgi:TonB family protein|nr:TonB family protein [Deltaproteobacteria bacterium]
MSLNSVYEDYPLSWFHPARQRLVVFIFLAAWIHLLAFLGWEQLGFEYLGSLDNIEAAPRLVEMTLELNPAALVEPAPEPVQTPVRTPAEISLPDSDQTETALKPPAEMPSQPPIPPGSFEPLAEDAQTPGEIPAETLNEPNLPLQSGASIWADEAEAAGPAVSSSPNNSVSVEETAPRFKSYNTTVRSAVARHWLLPPEARSSFQPGRFTAVMTLDRLGQVILIMVEESSGSPSLDYAAMEALRGAAPYEPFPEELAHLEQLSIRLHFDYRAVFRQAVPID